MRIAIVSELFYPHIGGQEQRYYEISRRLEMRGHIVYVLTIRTSANLPEEELREGVHILRYPPTRDYVRPKWRNPLAVLRYSIESISKARGLNADVCIFNQWPLLHIPFIEPSCKAKSVLDWCEIWRGSIGTLMNAISRLPDAHIAVDQNIARRLILNFKLPKDKVKVIPSGVDVKTLETNSDKKEKRVLYIGRLVPHKHVDLLIDAVKIASKRCPDVKLDIIGNGPLYPALIKRSGNADFIRFHGWVSERKKKQMLKKSLLLVLPSEREGFPRVVAEAMASKTPIITTNYEMNNAKAIARRAGSGIITKPTAIEIADAIVHLTEDRDLWERCAESGLAYALKKLDWEVVIKQLEDFLESCLGDG